MDTNERLNQIERRLQALESEVFKTEVSKKTAPEPVKVPQPAPSAPQVQTSIEPKPTLQVPKALIDLLNSNQWPPAVDPSLICDTRSEQDKEDRAEGILDLIIDISLENLKFLDYGCGEGHVINRSQLHKTKYSVGYDIKKSDRWEQWTLKDALLTDDWTKAKSFAPFNVVLMYDVIDHMLESTEDVISRLKEIKQLLAPNGRVYVRTHPYCSRHGTHLYHQINKAYAHLVFTEEELDILGYKHEKTRKIIHPIGEYSHLFKSAGFRIHNGPSVIKEGVEKFFFSNQAVSDRIKSNYKNSPEARLRAGHFPTFQLEQQFIDYILM
jgi:2-polyprenyl-3-methyl-5-hydroxy-6-metoxy-1,4-benzoquinol methylase